MALSCHIANGSSLPRNEECMLGELRVAGLASFTVFTVPEQLFVELSKQESLLSHGRAVTKRERDVVRKNGRFCRLTGLDGLLFRNWPWCGHLVP